ncbi:MAG TPA: hypothetical protein VN635_14455 [Conexibacter sp.]|nr:hypothetical protein [Conexibacter sp.]
MLLLNSSRTAACAARSNERRVGDLFWTLSSGRDVCKEEPACLQMAWTARCTGPQTIGAHRAALEYRTRSDTTVNNLFKAAVKQKLRLRACAMVRRALRFDP